MNGLQFLAVIDQNCPQPVEDAPRVPAADRPMHRRVAAEARRQVVPLAAGARPVDHAVQASALIGAGAAHVRRRVEFIEQREEQLLPQRIWGFPDRRQRLTLGCFRQGFRLAHASIIGISPLLG